MRVVEADNVLASFAAFPLDADELAGGDVVAIVRRILAGVLAGHDGGDAADVAIKPPEQHAATFLRIGLLRVAADFRSTGLVDFQHKGDPSVTCAAEKISHPSPARYYSCQFCSEISRADGIVVCDSQDLTLHNTLSDGVATVRP